MSRPKPSDPDYADTMNNPLPGAMMPTGQEEKFIPEKQQAAPVNGRKATSHFSDGDDQGQTIPV